MIQPNVLKSDNVAKALDRALDKGAGLLRLTPTWVPRSFLHPGRRIKLFPGDLYAYGANRGGIDERWFASTTEAANEGRVWHEGLSASARSRASTSCSATPSPKRALGSSARRCTRSTTAGPSIPNSSTTWGPIPHHMHQSAANAKLVGQEGKPESYYFPPQYNNVDNNFCYTFMGLEPGTTKDQVRSCLENWDKGENGILDLSRAYRLSRGTGWLIPPGVLHAPGSLCTYEPQWGSDVFGMFQNIVEGRYVPWSLLVKDMPKEKHKDLDFIIGQLDWEKNVDTHFKESNYLEPIVDKKMQRPGLHRQVDRLWPRRWRAALQCQRTHPRPRCEMHASKTPAPAAGSPSKAKAASESSPLQTPAMIRFGQETEDEVFISHEAATAGVEIENTGSEPLVGLRYFGPDVHKKLPMVGDYRKNGK